MPSISLAARAVELARAGFPVFPCLESKAPACLHGFKDATSNSGDAYRLFTEHPEAKLIGVPTGTVSNLAVIDVDPGGQRWLISEMMRGRLTETRVHQTRRGGRHLLYRLPEPNEPVFRNSASKLGRYVDTRGEGGFIIWWPASGGEVLHDVDMVPCPTWILKALYRKPKDRSSRGGGGDGARGAAGGLEPLLRFVAASREGERNNRLFWACLKAAESGSCRDLINAAVATGLPFIEAERTALSAMRHAQKISHD